MNTTTNSMIAENSTNVQIHQMTVSIDPTVMTFRSVGHYEKGWFIVCEVPGKKAPWTIAKLWRSKNGHITKLLECIGEVDIDLVNLCDNCLVGL